MIPSPRPVLRLDADLHVRVAPADLTAALARAAAVGLTDLGVTVRDPDRFDDYVRAVRSAGGLSRTRVHCGLEIVADGSTDLDATLRRRLSYVDYVLLVAERGFDAAALHAAGTLPVPVVLAGPVLADVPADVLARAGVTVAVTERWRTPSAAVARALAAAGIPLVAGSAARRSSAVGRWEYVRTVAEALAARPGAAAAPAPVPHPS